MTTDLSLKALRMRSTSSSRWMADASRLRRRSKSASDGAGVDVEDPAGVLEVEGFLDIAWVGGGRTDSMESTARRQISFASDGPDLRYILHRLSGQTLAVMVTNLQTLTRSLRTHLYPLYRTRRRPNSAHFSRSSPLFCVNPCSLHPRLDIPSNPFRTNSAGSSRTLSTDTRPPPRSPHARLVSARELYAQRNRSLFMYTSAVVRASLLRPLARPQLHV